MRKGVVVAAGFVALTAAGVLAIAVSLRADSTKTAAKPEATHHTVSVTAIQGTSSSPKLLITTSDGASWFESFQVSAGTPVTFTFTGLSGGHNAMDLANPNVSCGIGGGDRTRILMGSGATVTGGPISPQTFTVPSGVTAAFTASC